MTHPCGYMMHFFEKHTRTHTHTLKNNRATGPKRGHRAQRATGPKRGIFSCSNSHTCTYPCIHLSLFPFFFGADMKGAFLKEACRGPHIKRRCCSALQRIAAYCNVLQCVVTNLHAFLHPSFFHFLVADMGGTCRKETCKGPHIKCKSCRVLECVAVWRIEL